MEQEEVRFRNIETKAMTGWNRLCPYKSLGNVLYWIHVYCGNVGIADRVHVGNNIVEFFGKTMANFRFDDELEMPIFEFSKEYEYMQENQDLYLEGLKKYEPSEMWEKIRT